MTPQKPNSDDSMYGCFVLQRDCATLFLEGMLMLYASRRVRSYIKTTASRTLDVKVTMCTVQDGLRNASYHIISHQYHIIPHRITSYHIILHHTTSYLITSHSIISCYTVPSSKVMLAYYVKQTVPYVGLNLLKSRNHDAPIVCCGAICCLKHGRAEEWTCGTRTQNATHRHNQTVQTD